MGRGEDGTDSSDTDCECRSNVTARCCPTDEDRLQAELTKSDQKIARHAAKTRTSTLTRAASSARCFDPLLASNVGWNTSTNSAPDASMRSLSPFHASRLYRARSAAFFAIASTAKPSSAATAPASASAPGQSP